MRATTNKNLPSRLVRWAFLVGASLLLLGCPTDSPTAPNQTPTTPDTSASGSWIVTITGSDPSLQTNGTPSTLTITIRRAGSDELPADGATAGIVTSLGRFDDPVTGPSEGTISLIGGVAQVRLFPGDTAGTAVVQVQIETSVGSLSIGISQSVVQDFVVTGVTPAEGGTNGGDDIMIMGQGFQDPVRVFFGSIPAEVLAVANDLIRVLSPAGSEGFVTVNVTILFGSGDQKTFDFTSGFRYVDQTVVPIVFSVDPPSGPNEGGTSVAINGENFLNPVQVFFQGRDGRVGADIQSSSAMQIVVSSPTATGFGVNHQNQAVDVVVRNIASGLEGALEGGFRYGDTAPFITSIDPVEGPFVGGTVFRIFGSGFVAPLFVDIEGAGRQQVTSVAADGTRVTARTERIFPTSCTDKTGDVKVTIRDTGLVVIGPSFRYQVVELAPQIDSVEPTVITFDNPGDVTVRGSLLSNVRASIGGIAVPVEQVSTSVLKLDPPTFPDSFFDTLTCADADPRSEVLVPTSASVTVTSDDSKCTDTFDLAILVNPDTSKDDCSDPP